MISGRFILAGIVMATTAAFAWNAAGVRREIAAFVAPTPPPEAEDSRALPEPSRVIAEGRVVAYPGADVVVGTEDGGLILEVPVEEQSLVREGDLIARLQDDELQARRAEALARIAEAEADMWHSERQLQRTDQLLARGAGTRVETEDHERNLRLARARRAAAIAARDRFEALIAKTRITSPIDGVVIARFADPGEMVGPTTEIARILDLNRLRIEAEVDEYDVGKMSLGAKVLIHAEGYEDVVWHGTVEEIPDVVTSRRLRPEDPGRPTDTRVLLVKIAPDEPTPLKLGQRVEVEIELPSAP